MAMLEPIKTTSENQTLVVALQFLKTNYVVLAVCAAIAVLATAGIAYYLTQKRHNAERAAQMLMLAQAPKQFEELLAQYPRSPVAPLATLALASSQYAAGSYEQAQNSYMQFLRQYPRHLMAPAAEVGKIMCQEARGETEAAYNGYALFVITHANHFLLPQVLMGQARCLQLMGRLSEAKAIYEDFIVAHPKSEWVSQAEFALRFLERDLRAAQRQTASLPAGAVPPHSAPTGQP